MGSGKCLRTLKSTKKIIISNRSVGKACKSLCSWKWFIMKCHRELKIEFLYIHHGSIRKTLQSVVRLQHITMQLCLWPISQCHKLLSNRQIHTETPYAIILQSDSFNITVSRLQYDVCLRCWKLNDLLSSTCDCVGQNVYFFPFW